MKCAEWGRPQSSGPSSSLAGARLPYCGARGWAGRATASRRVDSRVSRKVRAPQDEVVGNTHPGQPAGSVPQRTDRLLLGEEVRVKRWCKRPPARRVTAVARQTPPGARPDSERSRAVRPSSRVGRWRLSATAAVDGWSPTVPSRGGTANRTRPMSQPIRTGSLTCGGALMSDPQSAGSPQREGSGRFSDVTLPGAIADCSRSKHARVSGHRHQPGVLNFSTSPLTWTEALPSVNRGRTIWGGKVWLASSRSTRTRPRSSAGGRRRETTRSSPRARHVKPRPAPSRAPRPFSALPPEPRSTNKPTERHHPGNLRRYRKRSTSDRASSR